MRKDLPGPNRWEGGPERGERRTRLREKLCYSLFSFFFDRSKVFQSGNKKFHEGTGILFLFFLSELVGFIFIVFAVLLCRAVLSLSYIQQAYQKETVNTLLYLGYVRAHGM